jgi:hypothetical protein
MLRVAARVDPFTDVESLEPVVETEPLQALLAAERAGALWTSFAKLSSRCQGLLRLLIVDPRPGHEEIGMALGMPIGSVGPTPGPRAHRRGRRVPGRAPTRPSVRGRGPWPGRPASVTRAVALDRPDPALRQRQGRFQRAAT